MPVRFTPDQAPSKVRFTPDESPEETTSYLESGLRGGAMGASLGYADEGEGVARAGYKKLVGGDPRGLGELYEEGKKEARGAFKKAEEDNPTTYGASELAGGIAPAFLPGAQGLAGAALLGTVAGSGYSEDNSLADIGSGTATGAAGFGVGKILGKGISAIPGATKKIVGSIFGPEEKAINTYLQRPEAVRGATKTFDELGDEVRAAISGLKKKGIDGSRLATELIPEKGTVFVGDIQDKFDDILGRYEGSGGFGDVMQGAKSKVQSLREEFNGLVKNQHIELRDLKNIIKNLDLETKIAKQSGQFSTPDNMAKAALRKELDQTLKREVPAYAEAMKDVASDFAALGPVSKKFGNQDTTEGTLKRAISERAGSSKLRGYLGDLEKRTGQSLIEPAENRMAREAFIKDRTAGSKGTWQGIAAGSALGGLAGGLSGADTKEGIGSSAALGAALGAVRDRYGGRAAQKILDQYLKASKLGNTSVIRALNSAMQKGPEALAVTSEIMRQKLGE